MMCYEIVKTSEVHFIEISKIHKNCFENSWSLNYLSNLMNNKINYGFTAKLKASTNKNENNDPNYIKADRCIGFVLFSMVHEYSEVLSLGILENWRCYGIGSDLMQHVITSINRSGARRLVLEVAENNISARKLYSGLGFIEVSQRVGYYKQSAGNVDAVILEKKIR